MRANKWNMDHAAVMPAPMLQGGYIPERTECPFVSECEQKAAGRCWHGGQTHPVPYKCATANLIALRKKAPALQRMFP